MGDQPDLLPAVSVKYIEIKNDIEPLAPLEEQPAEDVLVPLRVSPTIADVGLTGSDLDVDDPGEGDDDDSDDDHSAYEDEESKSARVLRNLALKTDAPTTPLGPGWGEEEELIPNVLESKAVGLRATIVAHRLMSSFQKPQVRMVQHNIGGSTFSVGYVHWFRKIASFGSDATSQNVRSTLSLRFGVPPTKIQDALATARGYLEGCPKYNRVLCLDLISMVLKGKVPTAEAFKRFVSRQTHEMPQRVANVFSPTVWSCGETYAPIRSILRLGEISLSVLAALIPLHAYDRSYTGASHEVYFFSNEHEKGWLERLISISATPPVIVIGEARSEITIRDGIDGAFVSDADPFLSRMLIYRLNYADVNLSHEEARLARMGRPVKVLLRYRALYDLYVISYFDLKALYYASATAGRGVISMVLGNTFLGTTLRRDAYEENLRMIVTARKDVASDADTRSARLCLEISHLLRQISYEQVVPVDVVNIRNASSDEGSFFSLLQGLQGSREGVARALEGAVPT